MKRPLCTAVLLSLLSLLLQGCHSAPPAPKISAELGTRYSREFPPRNIYPGWALQFAGRDINDLSRMIHRIRVEPEVAGDLLHRSSEQRREIVAKRACPEPTHPIWKQLDARQDIAIELSAWRGPFEVVSCRHELF